MNGGGHGGGQWGGASWLPAPCGLCPAEDIEACGFKSLAIDFFPPCVSLNLGHTWPDQTGRSVRFKLCVIAKTLLFILNIWSLITFNLRCLDFS